MTTIDDTLLASYGIVIPEEDKQEFYRQLGEQLEELVGMAIIDTLSDEDAKQLMELSASADDETVSNWIQQHIPNYNEIVERELDTILRGVAEAMAQA